MPEILNQTAEAKWLLGLKGTTTPATIEKEVTVRRSHLLEAARRSETPVARYTYELTQASPSCITSERRNDVLGVHRCDHPEPPFLFHRLDVRCPNQSTVRISLIWPWANVTEHNAHGAAGMNVDIHQKRGDKPVVILGRCFSDAKQIKIRVAFHVQIDCDRVDL